MVNPLLSNNKPDSLVSTKPALMVDSLEFNDKPDSLVSNKPTVLDEVKLPQQASK